MTANDIHNKLLQISNKYISGKPPLLIDSLANELNVSISSIMPHLISLKDIGIVEIENDVVRLTDNGLQAILP